MRKQNTVSKQKTFALIMVLASLFLLSIVFVMLNDTLASTQRMTQMFAIYPEAQEAWNTGKVWCNYILLTDKQGHINVTIDTYSGIKTSEMQGFAAPGSTKEQPAPYTSTIIDYNEGKLAVNLYKSDFNDPDQPFIEQYICNVNYFPQVTPGKPSPDFKASIRFTRYLSIDPLATYISVYPTGITIEVPKFINWKGVNSATTTP